MSNQLGVVVLVFLLFQYSALGGKSLLCPPGTQLELKKEGKKQTEMCVKAMEVCPQNDFVEILPKSFDSNGGCRVPHGPTRYTYEDGGQLIVHYVAGVIHGKSLALTPKKVLFADENYSQGLKQGPQKSFYFSGKKKSEENYVSGIKQGEQLTWHENGELESRSFYEEGVPSGVWTSWYPNGNKKTEVNSGKLGWEGLYRDWYANGRLHLAAQYKNGQLEGTYSLFYGDGKPMSERRYSKGLLEGSFEEWDEKGSKVAVSLYHEGKFQEWINSPKDENREAPMQTNREVASTVLQGDFDGNGYLDGVASNSAGKTHIVLRQREKTLKEIILSEPLVEIYSARTREGQFGEPATPRDGLVIWGKGKQTKVYLYDFNSSQFEMTSHLSDLDI